MKSFQHILGFALIGFTFFSCKNEDPFGQSFSEGEGRILTSAISIDVKNEAIATRSVPNPVAEDFAVSFYPKGEEAPLITYQYKDMPEVVVLPIGDYAVKAEYGGYYGEGKTAAFDAPHFKGESKEFSIQDGKIIDTIDPIQCVPVNVKVAINFSQELLEEFGKNVSVTVYVGDHQSDELTFYPNSNKEGYFSFADNSNTLVAVFEATIQGEKITEAKTYSDVKEGNFYDITFRLHSVNEDPAEDPSIKDEDPSRPGDTEPSTPENPEEPGDQGDNGEANDPQDPENPDETETKGDENGYLQGENGVVLVDATVTVVDMTGNGNQNLDPDAGETVDNINPDPANPGNSGGNETPDEEKPSQPSQPEEPSKPEQPEQPEEPNTPEIPQGEVPFLTSDDVDIDGVTDITSWNGSLKVKILTDSKVKAFKCVIDSNTLTPEELKSVGLPSELDLVNDIYEKEPGESESDVWQKLRGLGFPVGSDVTDPKLTENGKSVILFDITDFAPLLTALGPGEHNFIFTVENETGVAVKTLKLKNR